MAVATAVVLIAKSFSFQVLLINFFLSAAGIVDSLFPNVSWALKKLHLSFEINDPDGAAPSDWQLMLRKVSPVAIILLEILFLVVYTNE